jgi:hypothetical protein
MTKDTTLSCMSCLVNAAMRIERVFRRRENRIEFGFSDVGIEAIDLFQSRIAIDRETIRSEAYELA